MNNNLLWHTVVLICVGFGTFSCKKKGCTDELATNFKEEAQMDDGSCNYVIGCTDPTAVNYNPKAALDDESCRSFADWKDWILTASFVGPVDSANPVHISGDTAATRDVYFRQGEVAINGTYPEGTMIFKYARSGDLSQQQYVGMVKQAAGFNPESNDWEWFILNANGTIYTDNDSTVFRGGNLLDGYCTGCHNAAATDMVFSK